MTNSGVNYPMVQTIEIPPGIKHITILSRINSKNRRESESLLRKQEKDLRVLGNSLSALYAAATCCRKCWGGDHLLEGLAARVYNLACASYSLISIGYYDEALCLVRSIGEIANLLSLSVCDKQQFVEWLKSSKQDRIRKFSPVKFRKLLEQSGLTLMDQEWYEKLCESYVHVAPHAKINNFNENDRNLCGGFIQRNGIESCIDQLTTIVAMISLFYCQYFEFNDYFDLIVNEVEIENNTAS